MIDKHYLIKNRLQLKSMTTQYAQHVMLNVQLVMMFVPTNVATNHFNGVKLLVTGWLNPWVITKCWQQIIMVLMNVDVY